MTFLEPLCIRSQNQYLEIENYNKGIEEPTGNVMNRLELRSKKLYSKANADTKDLHEFEMWLKKLKKAISKINIALLEDKLNESLIRRFAEERSTTNLQIMSYFDTCRIIHLFIFFLNGEVAFSLDCKREFQLGIWNETDKRNSQGKEIIKAIE